jgi:RNA polymerase sigma-70 factor (ECF subfamily)
MNASAADGGDPPPEGERRTDRSLLMRFREGEQDAATELYVRYARRLQALAQRQTGADLAARFDPEDVVQSVFRTFFRRAAEGCYEAPGGEELWGLLLVIALNKVRKLASRHRAEKRSAQRTVAAEDAGELVRMADGDALAYDTMRLVVEELIESLPPPQDAVVRLRIEGHEVADIARATGRSKRTVERTLQQFRERLNRLIEEPG